MPELSEEVRAVGRDLRISPRKARVVIDLIRGKPVDEARAILQFCNKRGAEFAEKVLNSAVANAVHNNDLSEDLLFISEVYVDEGPTLKRWRPRALGRAGEIRKRTSHMTIKVRERREG